jgi:quercetin dioxygenase-like cupin family protein
MTPRPQHSAKGDGIMNTEVMERSPIRDRVIVLVSAEESYGELFRCEYVAREVSPIPRDHIHTHQEERLEVLEGTMRCRVSGVVHRLFAGQAMVMPAGTPHAVWNDDPNGSRSISEYRPAMNAEAMFREFISDRGTARRLRRNAYAGE